MAAASFSSDWFAAIMLFVHSALARFHELLVSDAISYAWLYPIPVSCADVAFCNAVTFFAVSFEFVTFPFAVSAER